MSASKRDTIIISLGGSLIVPDEIDVKFLKGFRNLILKRLRTHRFVIITGGGKTSRKYQNAAREITKLSDTDADWLGIHTTRLNAHFVKSLFKGYAYKKVVFNPTIKLHFKEDIMVAAGWMPGCSTDYDAILLAKNLGVKEIINLSNIDYVYDKDPKMHDDAKKIEKISWHDFKKIVGNKWDPGLNAPFDPIASMLAHKHKIKVVILNGKNLKNLDRCLVGKGFIGTEIE